MNKKVLLKMKQYALFMVSVEPAVLEDIAANHNVKVWTIDCCHLRTPTAALESACTLYKKIYEVFQVFNPFENRIYLEMTALSFITSFYQYIM